MDDRAIALIDAFLAALKDEAAAARSQRGESITSLSDGRLLGRTPEEASYSFLLDHPVAAMDDAPVEIEVYRVRYPGKVVYSTSEEIVVAIETADDLPPAIPHAGLIAHLDFIPRRLIERLTLVRSGDEPADLTLALRVFDPSQTPRADHGRPEAVSAPHGKGLNDGQVAAIEKAQRYPVSFVWGPPGTGKTATLARIAEAFCRQGKRVLVAAHSNVAVDEAAHDIVRVFGDDPLYRDYQILRLGHHRQETISKYDRLLFSRYTETVMRRLGPDRAAIAQQQRLALERARIVCATLTHVFFSSAFPQAPFDACLIDETSMAPMPALFWALTRCRDHAVLIGDFLQLPPVAIAQSEAARRWLGRNIYQYVGITTPDRARRDPRVVLLDRQYRMHPEIARLPNHLFYGNLLRTDTTQTASTHTPLLLVDTAASHPWCIRLPRGSRVNLHNASVAVHMAMSLSGPHEVAIITPYAAQARLIGALLRDRGRARTVRVATVHRFQGGEVPVLIFDSVEAPPERPAPMVNDLRDPSARLLLNVALTRAQRSLVVIGHQAHLRASLPRNAALVRLLDLMARHATVVESGAVLPPSAPREQFAADLLSASHDILAVTPAGQSWPPCAAAIAEAEQRGVHVTLMGHQSDDEQTAAARLPRPIVVIDHSVIWDGVPEPFAPSGSTARRLASARAAAAIAYAFMPPQEVQAGPPHLAPPVVISTRDPCPSCGALLDAIYSGGTITLICRRVPQCQYKRRMRKTDRIPTDIGCTACGHPTVLIPTKGRVFLGCSTFPRCRQTSSIERYRATA